jgi:flagellar biosynthesis chaperone FliJ
MTRSASSALRFPIIRRIEVLGYSMYPGKGAGLLHDFVPGVNAIVGINGLGKTTLLNIMLRMILGPYDPKKADAQEPGAKMHELTTLKRFNYFAARIGADARQATAVIELSFGKDTVRIERDLGPRLEIKKLRHNDLHLAADDELPYEVRYDELIAELSGIASRYDFDFVVRNLLFFLEDKVPLIWNPKGQFEILRILFLDEKLSAGTAKAHDKVMQLDSQYRNLFWLLGKLRDQHTTALSTMASGPEQINTLDAARKGFDASETKLKELELEFTNLSTQIENAKARVFAAEQSASSVSRHLEKIEADYLRKAFPDVPARVELLLGSLLAGGQCPVCGNTNERAVTRLQHLLSTAHCPCCESALTSAGKKVTVAERDLKEIRRLEEQLTTLEKEIEQASSECNLLEQERTETLEALYATQRERTAFQHKVRSLESTLPPGNDEFDRLTEGLRQQERQLEILKKERGDAQAHYDKLLEKARQSISEVADAIVRSFRRYAKNFLLEESQLVYELHKRQVGEGGPQMSFPSFVLRMSSAAAPTASVRESADQVSESQKEFVDLAFRMAILDVCTKRAGPGMLVIETPEASLDSVFIDRAGELLREFASGDDANKSNVIIATTNLNKENMLGHLLGVKPPVKSERARAAISGRIVNLLEIAAPTRAYRDNKREYDRALQDALGFWPN